MKQIKMTDEQMNKLVDLVAGKVFNKLKEKLKQLDDEFNNNVSDLFIQNDTDDVNFLNEEEFIKKQIKELQRLLEETIAIEDYENASEIQKNISQLKGKLD